MIINYEFYAKAANLRDSYLKTDTNPLKHQLLAKLVATAFSCKDSLPIYQEVNLDCAELSASYPEIRSTLVDVLEDLNYHVVSISPHEPFAFSHVIIIKIM